MDRLAALDELLGLVANCTTEADCNNVDNDDELFTTKEAVTRRRALRIVNDIFGNDASSRALVDGALDVLTSRQVYRVTAQPSRRSFIAIDPGVTTTAKRYVCFDDFCSCAAWHEAAMTAEGPVVCKHMLAARLAPFVTSSSASLKTEFISDVQYHEALSSRYDLP